MAPTLVAVDIGNSRIKLGLFDAPLDSASLPAPTQTLELLLTNHDGDFSASPLEHWCRTHERSNVIWRICSVHGGAKARLLKTLVDLERRPARRWSVELVVNEEVALPMEVAQPEQVGTDRLMAALAANRLRTPDRAAIVIDLGTAVTVDLVTAAGAFAGGAILPGLAMSARALAEQTDALPLVPIDKMHEPPAPIGKATQPAIESGLFWGAVGALRELIRRYSEEMTPTPEVFISGGTSRLIADVLAQCGEVEARHVPHLVLSGIALVKP
jgi:type III pantothenate kinase